jgi:hypothetical protein
LCARVTKTISALIARDAVHAGLVIRLKHPSMRTTTLETDGTGFCIGNSLQ